MLTEVTIKTLQRMVRDKTPIACLTCYDATTARLLQAARVPLLLVGGAAAWFSSQRSWMFKAAGIMVALMGCFNLFRHIRMLF